MATNRIKKTDDFYQESLIWMGYRYAIGLTDGNSKRGKELLERFKVYRDIEYDTPAFHALAAEIANYLKRKKIKDVVDLSNRWMEGDMMWYSMHYGIGRRTYAGSHCHDIVRYGREVLSPERREFNAYDIRREITMHLNYPFNFHMPSDGERRLDPIDMLMGFLIEHDVRTDEQMAQYKWIEVVEHRDGSISYKWEMEEEPNMRCYHDHISTINSLLEWDDLAKYFDPKFHKRCRVRFEGREQEIEYFDSWDYQYGCPGEFPYRKLKRPIDSYEKKPYMHSYINEEYIVEDDI
ncbi:MAG: hypothetical protein K6F78_07075 [Bacteroidaceae bacterium]|nr:hypothetical protein [Bacteroidaceae bacterium]